MRDPDMPSASSQLTEHLFRKKHGEMLGALVRGFGQQHFALLEEAIQTAFQRALETWPVSGVPQNPAGWLYQVARNAALDALRKEKIKEQKFTALEAEGACSAAALLPSEKENSDHAPELDDLATMILLCCNPELSAKAQVCLTLKAACGFSVHEIARALGMEDEAVKKTITRAKDKIAEAPENLRALDPKRIAERFALVLEVVYAMFTEGYSASGGESQLRNEIAETSIRLADVLLASQLTPVSRHGELHALMALMLLQYARFAAREDENGVAVRLQEQERGKWRAEFIHAGLVALEHSREVAEPTVYHFEARIAAEHAINSSFAATNWKKILALYEQLLAVKDTEQVRLNRIVALRYAEGPEAALRELEAWLETERGGGGKFGCSFLFHAVWADLLEACGRAREARAEWQSAMQTAPTGAERKRIEKKLEKIPE